MPFALFHISLATMLQLILTYVLSNELKNTTLAQTDRFQMMLESSVAFLLFIYEQ